MARRINVGQRYSNEYGLWVSRPGKDIYSTGSPDFLVDGSVEQSQPYIVGSVSRITFNNQAVADPVYFNMLAAYSETSIYHNLGYLPMIWMWKDYTATSDTYGPQTDVNGAPHYNVYYDTNRILLQGWIPWRAGVTFPYLADFQLGYVMRYVIFKNRAAN